MNEELLNNEEIELLRATIERTINEYRYKVKFYTQWGGSVYFTITDVEEPWGVIQCFGLTKEKHLHKVVYIQAMCQSSTIILLENACEKYNELIKEREKK